MNDVPKRASMLAIGDELLTGKTQDTNIHYLAAWLNARGVKLCEARMVPDEKPAMISALNDLREKYDYVFTSGGIGPTHDDITAETVGEAFGVSVTIRDDARAILQDYYDAREQELNDARLRMARIPDTASLILNDVSGAPGFQIKNVYVMAGVPPVFRAMLNDLDARLEHGPIPHAMTICGNVAESAIAAELEALQDNHDGISIGSYPGKNTQGFGVAVVVRGFDKEVIDVVVNKVVALMKSLDVMPEIKEGEASL